MPFFYYLSLCDRNYRYLKPGAVVERITAEGASGNRTKSERPAVNPNVIADKLAIAENARAKSRTTEEAARLVGRSRATLYRRQQAQAISQTLNCE